MRFPPRRTRALAPELLRPFTRSPAIVAAALVLTAAGVSAASPAPPGGLAAPRYRVAAQLDLDRRTITGDLEVEVTNAGSASLDRLLFDLYPNRFREETSEVNDVTRAAAYPRLEFVPGGVEVSAAAPAGAAAPQAFRVIDWPGLPGGTVLELPLSPPLAPGATIKLRIAFTTRVPERYGPFGASEQGLAAVAGWFPTLAELDPSGAWQPGHAPAPADVAAQVSASPAVGIVLGDRVFPAGHAELLSADETGVRTFALIALPEMSVAQEDAGGTHFTFAWPTPEHAQRLAPGPDPEEALRQTVEAAVERRPPGLAAPRELTVVQIPLRWNLTTPADGLIVVSDRAMHVQDLLRGFHDAQISQAVYANLLRQRVFACEAPADRHWVQQAVAWGLADRFVRDRDPEHRDVHWWIDWLDVFAIVDRFEFAPKIPFVQSFFPNAKVEDDLRESVFTYGSRRAPPRLVLARLDRRYGAATTAQAIDEYAAAPASTAPACETFAASLAHASGTAPSDVAAAVATATEPPKASPGPGVGGEVDAIVDPDLRPPNERFPYQFVLDTADVEVSSTEFGLAALFVARRTHDYTKDFAINPFYTERSYGVNAGPRLHFGDQVDPVTYKHNLFGFYRFAGLDSGFKDDSEPDLRQSGHVAAFGLRYDYSNVYWYDNPTDQRDAHAFVDWYDSSFGSDYGFVRYGGRVSGTTPLFTPRTIGAVELLAGFETPTSAAGAPIQEQFSLGGRRALRGVSVNSRLARNIGLARFELRQDVFPEMDLNLLDLLTYRRPQLTLFCDTGQVDNSAGRALDPAHWAVAGGIGFNALYDFLGFFPGRAYIELGTRFDRDQTDIQVLFGTRQAF